MCEEFEENEIEREKYDEQRYYEYITEEDNRWLLQLVEEIEHESNERKFINDTMKTLSLGGTVVVTKVKSDRELDEIQAFEERRQMHEEEMCIQYLIDEDDRFLYDTVVELEEQEGLKFLKESVNKFSENAPKDDMDLECPEDEFDEIRREQEEFALQMQAEKFIQLEKEEEMHVQITATEYDFDEDERLLGNVAFDVESMFAESAPTSAVMTPKSTPKKRQRRGATHYMPKKRKTESYYASPG